MAAAATLRGTGSYVPEQVITNRDLERIVDTSDEWIVSHTGMRERRIAGPEQATSDLATVAAQRALADADLTPADIDFVICTTITPDMAFPATACIVQANLGIKAPAFDLTNGCTGFIYGLTVADSFVRAGAYRNVLVISADCLTRITNWTDRSTCVLFGDAAGAAVVSPCEAGYGVLAHELGSLGELGDLLLIPAGGSRVRLTPRLLEQNMETMSMNGPELYKVAVRMVPELAERVVVQAGLQMSDVDLVVMHQANQRIMDAAARRLDLPNGRVYSIIEKYGNSSASTVPLALDLAYHEGRIKSGDHVLLLGFGAGFTLGGAVIRWTK
ncbi:MAG: ketoacyl-ACP synthase III [candidate division WS1 bacterium]|jgi:3-oxoacyl-[acyl-carrier-protein] synthase-3|nr:ketoacyl-ACP synthase III [candidate division WS1 bacterium]